MVEYLDSGDGDPGKAVGPWLAEHLVPGVQAVRIQTGFFSIGSLRDHLDTLGGIDVIRLVLGSNAPEQPTADDVRQLVPLIAGHGSRSLTLVRFAGSALFHPKTIHLVREDGTALAYVGSANLTEYGLGFNAEAGVVLGPDEGDALAAVAAATDAWADRDEQGVFQVRGEEDVDDLLAQRVLQTAEQRRATRAANRRERRAPEGGGGGLQRARLWRPATPPGAQGGRTPAEAGGGEAGAVAEGGAAAMRWCKKLKRSDAQQVPAGTNPTGKLRLAQARFPIDHQRYFRDEFFGDATWAEVERRGTLYEECSVPFNVSIHDADLGEQVLRVDHAPHRVAAQNNVPTVLGWGPVLGRHLREHSEVDNWVVLERDEDGAYSLAITDEKPGWAP